MDNARPIGPRWLHERIARGGLIILDGATGSELERRGVGMHAVAWSGACIIEHGDVLRGIHEDYIRAGADIIITNTFSTARHMLEPIGFGDQVERINRRAVEIAREARDNVAKGEVAIAGSMANFLADSHDLYWCKPSILRSTYAEQASALAEAGVDLIALEMLQRPEVAEPAVDAALDTGLPVWAGVSCRAHQNGRGLKAFDYPDQPFEDIVKLVASKPVAVITVMHSEVPDTGPGLEAVRHHWDGWLGAYPNSGYFNPPHWEFVDIVSPQELVDAARHWITQGARIVGGCCGLGPAHVDALKQQLPNFIDEQC